MPPSIISYQQKLFNALVKIAYDHRLEVVEVTTGETDGALYFQPDGSFKSQAIVRYSFQESSVTFILLKEAGGQFTPIEPPPDCEHPQAGSLWKLAYDQPSRITAFLSEVAAVLAPLVASDTKSARYEEYRNIGCEPGSRFSRVGP